MTDENYRRGGPVTDGAFSAHRLDAPDQPGVRNAHMLRNYMNDGGKVLLAGRNLWVQQTTHRHARSGPAAAAASV